MSLQEGQRIHLVQAGKVVDRGEILELGILRLRIRSSMVPDREYVLGKIRNTQGWKMISGMDDVSELVYKVETAI